MKTAISDDSKTEQERLLRCISVRAQDSARPEFSGFAIQIDPPDTAEVIRFFFVYPDLCQLGSLQIPIMLTAAADSCATAQIAAENDARFSTVTPAQPFASAGGRRFCLLQYGKPAKSLPYQRRILSHIFPPRLSVTGIMSVSPT